MPQPDWYDFIEQFEDAWSSESPPELSDFWQRLALPGQAEDRRALLAELVAVDLEYRWRTAAEKGRPETRRLVTDYLEIFPELNDDEAVKLELLSEEYRARRKWEEQACTMDDFMEQFPDLGDSLGARLSDVEGELLEEILGDTKLCLHVVAGFHVGQSVTLKPQGSITIGRDPAVELCLHDDLHVSRLHVRVDFDGVHCSVQDNGSKNGTKLNGRSIHHARCQVGDLLTVGETKIRVVAARPDD